MQVRRIQHVSIGIEAGREEEGRRFYGEALGLSHKRRPMGLKDRPLTWFDVGDNEDEIHLISTPGYRAQDLGGNHLCFEVDDIAAMRARMQEHGVAIEETSVIDNRPRFFVTDPFGNRIELAQITGKFTPVDE